MMHKPTIIMLLSVLMGVFVPGVLSAQEEEEVDYISTPKDHVIVSLKNLKDSHFSVSWTEQYSMSMSRHHTYSRQ